MSLCPMKIVLRETERDSTRANIIITVVLLHPMSLIAAFTKHILKYPTCEVSWVDDESKMFEETMRTVVM